MLNLVYLTIFVLTIAAPELEAINPKKCNSNIEQTRCVVEESATYSAWYVYDQVGQKCVLLRWSDECDSPGDIVNVYSSYKECADECDRELKARRRH